MNMELDERFMDLALDEGHKAESAGEIPVGAIAVADGRVIGRGFNQPISTKDPTAHAEILALREAARTAGNYRLSGITLYCTVEPCLMCAGAMIHARIYRLVLGAPDPKAGAAGSLYNVVSDPRLNHRILVTLGVREAACSALLREFFSQRR
jgi:tRNA(adenine34) deaminase